MTGCTSSRVIIEIGNEFRRGWFEGQGGLIQGGSFVSAVGKSVQEGVRGTITSLL